MNALIRRFSALSAVLAVATLMSATSAFGAITAVSRVTDTGNCAPSLGGALTDGAGTYCDRTDPLYTYTNFPQELTDVLSQTEYVIVSVEDRIPDTYALNVTVDYPGSMLLFIPEGVDVATDMPWVIADGYAPAIPDGGTDPLELTLDKAGAFENVQLIIWVRDVDPGEIALGPVVTESQDTEGEVGALYGVAYVTDQVDIEIVVENLGSEPVTAGVTDDWWVKVTATNNGPDDASGLMFDISTVVSGVLGIGPCSIFQTDGLIYPAPGPDPGDDVVWEIGPLEMGQSAIIERKCTANPLTSDGATLDRNFSLRSVDQLETPTDNNSASFHSSFQREVTFDITKTWDGGEVDVNLTCSDGTDVSTTTSGLTAQFTHTGFADGVNCVVTETIPDGYSPSYTADCDVTGVLSGSTYSCGITNAETLARFHVTKTFSDGSIHDVDVEITCDDGLPLTNSATITSGDITGVNFVVTDFIHGTLNCDIAETSTTPGYEPSAGCSFPNVTSGDFECPLTNAAEDGTFTANMEWIIPTEGGDEVDEEVEVTISCDSEITGGSICGLNGLSGPDGLMDCWDISKTLGDGEYLTAIVDTTLGSATCKAVQGTLPSGVEPSSAGCGPRTVAAGDSLSCTFTNTVFFEGIPTLSQYGLALLTLLMLGVGMVGFRRFA